MVEKAYKKKLEWFPIVAVVFLLILSTAVFIIGFASHSATHLEFGSLLLMVLGWVIYFWLILYMVVEFVFWKTTRNVGHRLQFLGVLILVLLPLYVLIPLLVGRWSALFSPYAAIIGFVNLASFAGGIALALFGYYCRGYRAADMDLYRNVVVREGERIEEVTDGHSTRVFTVRYDDIPKAEISVAARDWATTLSKAGFLLKYDTDETGIRVFPVTYAGIGSFRIWTALTHVYWIVKKPMKLTWVLIDWDGRVDVHISSYDYGRICRPVAYHSLCTAVADAMVTSLLAFSRGDTEGSIRLLLGSNSSAIQSPKLANTKEGGMAKAATIVGIVLILAGVSSSLVTIAFSQEWGPLVISNVRWFPDSPEPGDSVRVVATLAGIDESNAHVESFELMLFSYFNDTGTGLISMERIIDNDYEAYLGSFLNGTELTFSLWASVRRFGALSSYESTVFSEPYVLRIGKVLREGGSGLTIGDVYHEMDSEGNIEFSIQISSSATVKTAQLFFVYRYAYSNNDDSGGGAGISRTNLTMREDRFIAEIPHLWWSIEGEDVSAAIHYKVVAQDTTWNTDTTELMELCIGD